MRRSRGFTALEVLVVCACVGILASLALVAVTAAIERSRRLTCSSHLRNLGTALTVYQASHGGFPSHQEESRMLSRYFSTQLRLLPYLEVEEVFDAINLLLPQVTPRAENASELAANLTVSRRKVGVFLCPSDPGSRDRVRLSYRVCLGAGIRAAFEDPADAGAFAFGDWRRPAEFARGLSKTAAMSERLTGDFTETTVSVTKDAWYTSASTLVSDLDAAKLYTLCSKPANSPLPHRSDLGGSWLQSGFVHSAYNHLAPPNWTGMDCSSEGEGLSHFPRAVMSARSAHKAGVNQLYMDGSVTWVSDNIDLSVYRNAARIVD
jgi:Tfp pilus assembly protein PilE